MSRSVYHTSQMLRLSESVMHCSRRAAQEQWNKEQGIGGQVNDDV
jgi:hypothetical protein